MMDGQRLTDPGDPTDTGLSAKEIARAIEIAQHFDPRPSHAILQFGAAPQKRMADLAALIRAQTPVVDAGPTGDVPATDMALIVEKLKRARHGLLSDIAQFEMLHEEAAANFREILVYIRAAEIKLAEWRAEHSLLERHAGYAANIVAARKARDLAEWIGALERQLHDLKMTAIIAREIAREACVLWFNGQALVKSIQNSIRCAQVAIDSDGMMALR